MRFTSVRLANWKNFRSADILLHGRAFIIGPNASGKSNFLDVFRFLSEIASVGGGFQAAIGKRDGVTRIRCLAARRYPAVEIGVTIGDDDDEPSNWRYELSFMQDNHGNPFVSKERVYRGKDLILDRPDRDDKRDERRLSQTYLEQVNANYDFREIVDFFQTIRYLHVVPQLIREPDRSVGKRNDPFGGDFLEELARTTKRTRESRLNRIQDALTVAVPQLDKLEIYHDPRGTPHLRGNYKHWRVQGAWQEENQFSDGTLRLIGLLWSTLDGSGPLLLEEPELSLHPEVVRYLPQMFARMQRRTGRQILLSTHSPDLLRDTGIGLDEVLILKPTSNGTEVTEAAQSPAIRAMIAAGVDIAEAVLPMTRPANADQLALFADI